MRLIIIWQSICLFCISCSLIPLETNLDHTLTIEVTRHMELDQWKIRYQLPYPVEQLIFERQRNQFRKGRWNLLSKNLKLDHKQGKEVIFSPLGRKFSTIVLEFSSYYDFTPKDYEFFRSYVDGGVLMFTGHLYAFSKKTIDKDKQPWKIRLKLKGRSNDRIVLLGNVFDQNAQWKESTKHFEGTYIYFGKTKIQNNLDHVGVIDNGLPQWIVKETHDFLPRLFKFYQDKTGVRLNFKPIIYFSYADVNQKQQHGSGGTLPGIVQISLSGQNWQDKNQKNRQRYLKLLAHEIAHLWNSQMFDRKEAYATGDASWLHEGGADSFAFRALYQLGIITQKKLKHWQTNALNRCIMNVENFPLNQSDERRLFENDYTCGSTLNFLAEKAIQKINPKEDIFSLWKKIFNNAQKKNNFYNERDFYHYLQELSKDQSLAKNIEHFCHQGSDNVSLFFAKAFAKMNQQLRPIAENGKEKKQNRYSHSFYSSKAVRSLVLKDCRQSISLMSKSDEYLIEGMNSCSSFKKGKKYHLTHVGPHALKENSGNIIYRYLYQQCRDKNAKVSLSFRDKSLLKVSCPKKIAKIPMVYQFE